MHEIAKDYRDLKRRAAKKSMGKKPRISSILMEIENAVRQLNLTQSQLLRLLLLGDITLIVLFVLHRINFYFLHTTIPFLKDQRFALAMEWGYGEIFQYVKELGCTFIILGIGLRRRQWGFFVWALLFFYLFLDDALSIHETLGAVVTDQLTLHPISGINPDGLGQMLISLIVGVPLVLGLMIAFLRDSNDFRLFCWQMGFVLAALVACGIAIDMIDIEHEALSVKGIITIFEDGGEMIVMSVALVVAFLWVKKETQSS